MIFTRTLIASRGASMARARAPMLAPLAARRPASSIPGNDPSEGDPVHRETKRSQDWTTAGAIGGVGILVVTIFYYMTTRPEDAKKKQAKAQEAVTETKNKVKETVYPNQR